MVMKNPFDRCAGTTRAIEELLGGEAYRIAKFVAEHIDDLGATIDAALTYQDLKIQILADNLQTKQSVLKALPGRFTPEQFGGIGDGVSSDTDAIEAAIAAASNVRGQVIFGEGKIYRSTRSITLPVNTILSGTGTLRFSAGRINAANNCVLRDFTIDGTNKTNNDDLISISNCNNVLLNSVRLNKSEYNGISVSNSTNVLIDHCVGNDIGSLSSINPTFGGMLAYVSASDNVHIRHCAISRTRGLGALFFNNCKRISATDNDISDVRFRGVHASDTTDEAVIARNQLMRMGEIDQTDSAVGCNGIFVTGDWRKTTVKDNIISYCAENGIEGDGRFFHNVINHCGYKSSLASPSKTGIYVNSGIARWNSINGAPLHGISAGPFDGSVYDIDISDNEIEDFSGSGVLVHINGSGAIGYNIVIARNTVRNPREDATASINLATTGGAAVQNAVIMGNLVPVNLPRFLPGDSTSILGNSWQT